MAAGLFGVGWGCTIAAVSFVRPGAILATGEIPRFWRLSLSPVQTLRKCRGRGVSMSDQKKAAAPGTGAAAAVRCVAKC